MSVPETMQGKSWIPLLDGKTEGWREGFLYEYFYENRFQTPTIAAFRTASAKLIAYPGHPDWTELYDLSADPYEMKNLIGDPAVRTKVEEMKSELARLLKESA